MSYITVDAARRTLDRLTDFHNAQSKLHARYAIDFSENIGRRNIIMSRAQEKFLADELSQTLGNVCADGRTGYPDIMIHDLGIELECKITSPNEGGGSIAFLTDHGVLAKKGPTDYVYIICNNDFNRFAFLHFVGLTADDFRDPSDTSRGKSGMNKAKGMRKCSVLHGEVVNLRHSALKKISEERFQLERNLENEFSDLESTLKTLESTVAFGAQARRSLKGKILRVRSRIENFDDYVSKKIGKINERDEKSSGSNDKYHFELLPL